MAKRVSTKSVFPETQREHIKQLTEWMSQGVYEKEQIIGGSGVIPWQGYRR